jgi:acyl carrier protein
MELVGVGRPAAGLELHIVDPETQKECSPNRIGEIWVAGASVTRGYWGREEETERVFRASLLDPDQARTAYLRTGDLGFVFDGELFVAGRVKDLIIVNGANFHPQDVEEAVDHAHPTIRFGCTAAFGLERSSGEVLGVVAEVRTDDPSDLTLAADAVRRTVTERVGITPELIAFIPARTLPKTSSGKVRRSTTRAALLDKSLPTHAIFEDRTPSNGPPDPLAPDAGAGRSALVLLGTDDREAELTRMAFEAIRELNDEAGGALAVDTPVAELGLDSVHVVELLAAMEERCGVVLPMENLARGVTIRQLVRAVSDELDRDDGPTGNERGLG